MKTKLKEAFQNYLKYSFNSILNISHRSRFRALDPNLAKPDSQHCLYGNLLSHIYSCIVLSKMMYYQVYL